MIPVYKPYLPPGSLSQAHEAMDSTWLSSQGKYLNILEEKLQELLGVQYIIPLNNGTSACHLVAKDLWRTNKPESGKKKIVVPNNVYVAAWNAFLFDNNYELIPVDADLNTWNMDLNKLEEILTKYPGTDVLIVHNIGNVINVPSLQKKYPHSKFVEDNCEGFLGKYENKFSGTVSTSAISFFGNKNITSGEGGAFITQSEDAYLYAKCIQGQGQSSKRFVHSDLGYNYRMTNIQAAILCGQIDLLPKIEQLKADIFGTYRKALDQRDDIKIQQIERGTQHSNWMFGVRVIGNSCYEKSESYFKSHGIEIRPMFYPIDAHQHLINNPNVAACDNINAALLNKECFILPSFPELTTTEQHHILSTLDDYMKDM